MGTIRCPGCLDEHQIEETGRKSKLCSFCQTFRTPQDRKNEPKADGHAERIKRYMERETAGIPLFEGVRRYEGADLR
jgi:hypothetical protein